MTAVHIAGAAIFVVLWLIALWSILQFWRAYARWKRAGRGRGSMLYLDVVPVRLADVSSLFVSPGGADADQREARDALIRALVCVAGGTAVVLLLMLL